MHVSGVEKIALEFFEGVIVVSTISDRVINIIEGNTIEIPESFCSSDLVIFKPRYFVEGDNQFDFYHFVIPIVDIAGFFVDDKEIAIKKGTILPTNPFQKLRVSPMNENYIKSDDVKFICMFIEPDKLKEITKAEFNKTEFSFYNNTFFISNNILNLISKFKRNIGTGSLDVSLYWRVFLLRLQLT